MPFSSRTDPHWDPSQGAFTVFLYRQIKKKDLGKDKDQVTAILSTFLWELASVGGAGLPCFIFVLCTVTTGLRLDEVHPHPLLWTAEKECIIFVSPCLLEYFSRGVLEGAFVWWVYHTPGYFHCLTESMSTPSPGKESLPSIKGWLYPFLSENEHDVTGNIFPVLWLPGSSVTSDTQHDDRGTFTFVLSSYFLCPVVSLTSYRACSLFKVLFVFAIIARRNSQFPVPPVARHIAVNENLDRAWGNQRQTEAKSPLSLRVKSQCLLTPVSLCPSLLIHNIYNFL